MSRVVESWDGLKWLVKEGAHSSIQFSGDRLPLDKTEWTGLQTLTSLGSKSLTFVDIGAWVGSYTVRMAQHYREVYAFEPNPDAVEHLKMNLQLSKVTNVKIFQVAVGDKAEDVDFYVRGPHSTIIPQPPLGLRSILRMERLDNLIEGADVIKIDVEGWEEKVLDGAERILRDSRPVLLIEHHEYIGYPELTGTRQRIRERLKEHVSIGFNGVHWFYVPKDRDLSPFIHPMVQYWFERILINIKAGEPWYLGFPHTWWWGLSAYEFITELPKHILNEREWVDENR